MVGDIAEDTAGDTAEDTVGTECTLEDVLMSRTDEATV